MEAAQSVKPVRFLEKIACLPESKRARERKVGFLRLMQSFFMDATILTAYLIRLNLD